MGTATKTEIAHLEALYDGRNAYHGEMHDHSNSGNRSDGKQPLTIWKTYMESLGMDFAVIADHKQVSHMYLPEWDDTIFVGASEATTWIKEYTHTADAQGKLHNALDYNMIFDNPESLLDIFRMFPEYRFSGTPQEGSYPLYPHFSREQLIRVAEAVKEKGGLFVLVHPKRSSSLVSPNPLDYWFTDWTGLEVIYRTRDSETTKESYKLWTDLLAQGKHLWATAGYDGHNYPTDKTLSTVYATEKKAEAVVDRLRVGDFTAGPVGIRMCIGETVTGGQCDFAGQRLIVSVGDFHKSVKLRGCTYRMDLFKDSRIVFSKEIPWEETSYFAFDAEDCGFYRVEVRDTTDNSLIALGNPIWNAE